MKIEFSVDVPSSIALNSAWHFIAALSDVASAERDFYAQNSYAERGTDNLAKFLGVPHLTMFDVALLIPLIPVLAILISWWAKPDEFSTRRDVASNRLSDGTRKYRLGRLATDGVMRFAEKNHGALFFILRARVVALSRSLVVHSARGSGRCGIVGRDDNREREAVASESVVNLDDVGDA